MFAVKVKGIITYGLTQGSIYGWVGKNMEFPIMLWSIILTLLPILVIVYCMVRKQYAADTSGVIGWALTLAITILFFDTAPEVGLRSSLAGIIASFPVSLMVVTSILQITFMEATGALGRVTVFVKTFGSANRPFSYAHQRRCGDTACFRWGYSRFHTASDPVALGYSSFVAVALPAIGFDALCTFALLGAPLVVYSDLTGTPLVNPPRSSPNSCLPSPSSIGFGMLWIVGGGNS